MEPRIPYAQAALANIDMRFLRIPRDMRAVEQGQGALPRGGDLE